MRTLSGTLEAAQQDDSIPAIYKVVLTKGETTYTYDQDRILPSSHDEEGYSQRAKIILDNSDGEFDEKNLKGFKAVISYGVTTGEGDEYSACAPLWVMDQQFNSVPGELICELDLVGIPNLMADDRASESYMPESGDTLTVKNLVEAICGATLDCFNHCLAYEVVWDTGYDPLADTYKPKDSFRIYTRGTRLAALRRVLDYTANVARFEADGKVHILSPVMTGEVYDYEYNLTGGHTFFKKAYRETLVIPNKITVQSRPDDDPQYSGSAQVSDYDDLPDAVKKTEPIQLRLTSDDEADDIAEALIAKATSGTERGAGEVPINVGAEVYDYVKVTDQRQNDSRTGNLGYVHRKFGGGEWTMTFGFGNWLEVLRYQRILKGLETYTDLADYPGWQAGEAWEMPRSFQAYACDVVFTAVDWNTVSWGSGTLTLADGQTQAVNSGSLDLANSNPYYFYVAWGNATLQYSQTYTDVLGDDRFFIGSAARGSSSAVDAYIITPPSIYINRDQVMDDLITELQLADEAVTAAKIAVNAVIESKIASDAVTNAKIANAAVDTAQLASYAVTNIKLDDLAVSSAKIASGAITETKIDSDAVTTPKIAANAVVAACIAAGAVIAAKIDAGAVTSEKIYAGAVTTDKLDALCVTAAKIQAGAVISEKIQAGAVVAAKIAAGAVEALAIATGAITADKIYAGAVGADAIASGAITAGKIGADAVQAGNIAAGAVQAGDIAANAVTATTIAAGAIDTDHLSARSITAGKIDFDAIGAEHIDAGAIEAEALESTLILSSTIWAGDGKVKLSSSGIQVYSSGTEFCQITEGQINIWGRSNGLVTRATKTGTIQCYVGSDGAIYAGGGNVYLNSSGLHVKGQYAAFYYGATIYGYAHSAVNGFCIEAASNHSLNLIATGSGLIYLSGDVKWNDVLECNNSSASAEVIKPYAHHYGDVGQQTDCFRYMYAQDFKEYSPMVEPRDSYLAELDKIKVNPETKHWDYETIPQVVDDGEPKGFSLGGVSSLLLSCMIEVKRRLESLESKMA